MSEKKFVTEYLIKTGMTITFMESCTSGLLASMFTDTEGASAVFKGSLVTYSNDMKMAAGVDAAIIEKYGVYSAECASSMAKTAQQRYKTDIAVGITGTTGNPDPLNPGSLEGEAFYCIVVGDKSYDYHLKKDVSNLSREDIKKLYADEVYGSLKDILEKH